MSKIPAVLIVLALALGACTSVYRADVQQGNVVTTEMVNTLKLGMSKRQVRYILGSPLINDVFHKDRWDYVYSMQRGKGPRSQQRLTVIFQNDALVAIEGDLAPASQNSSAVTQ